MKKVFLLLITFLITYSFSACSQDILEESEPTNRIDSPTPTVLPTDAAVKQQETTGNIIAPTGNLRTQTQFELPSTDIGIKATLYVHHIYTRYFDLDGNYLNNGHVTYTICGNCNETDTWLNGTCTHCDAEYTGQIDIYEYETFTCDTNNWEIVYDVSYEPFEVK